MRIMSPELELVYSEMSGKLHSGTTEKAAAEEGKRIVVDEAASMDNATVKTSVHSDGAEPETEASSLAPRVPRRERRPAVMALLDTLADPLSPVSSSVTADTTFEPTIDMMVNDFDDEQTLNEEEALAALESQNPHDEIATLKEESEMPLEELLAMYGSMPAAVPEVPRKKSRKSVSTNKKAKCDTVTVNATSKEERVGDEQGKTSLPLPAARKNTDADVIVIESGDDEEIAIDADKKATAEVAALAEVDDDTEVGSAVSPATASLVMEKAGDFGAGSGDSSQHSVGQAKPRRSRLLDLYPEESFAAAASLATGADGKDTEELYGEEDEDDDEADEDEEEGETETSDYVQKTIMVGAAYQAAIPDGLSQYGDVLPYENEDKLVWEPSQVSEREVEEYLVKAREIKHSLPNEELSTITTGDETVGNEMAPVASSDTSVQDKDSTPSSEENTVQTLTTESKTPKSLATSADGDLGGVVKDNEQALHLLVQCGYDFKEALRRKRLNALPLTCSMSLWSEDECHKFEEGIQKFGKDFYKIRQNQVRTRTMRELVHFYYLWKKSERRDHNFANSDTVDHMDIYLDEGGDFGTNANATPSGIIISATVPQAFGARKTCMGAQRNFSIMGSPTSNASNVQTSAAKVTTATAASTSNSRKRSAGSGLIGASNSNSDNQSGGAERLTPTTK